MVDITAPDSPDAFAAFLTDIPDAVVAPAARPAAGSPAPCGAAGEGPLSVEENKKKRSAVSPSVMP